MIAHYMQTRHEVSFTDSAGVEHIATYKTDARTGHAWVMAIENAETGEQISHEAIERDGTTSRQVWRVVASETWAELHQLAVVAMAREIENTQDRACT